jgi:hypothetical protein
MDFSLTTEQEMVRDLCRPLGRRTRERTISPPLLLQRSLLQRQRNNVLTEGFKSTEDMD